MCMFVSVEALENLHLGGDPSLIRSIRGATRRSARGPELSGITEGEVRRGGGQENKQGLVRGGGRVPGRLCLIINK